MMISSCTGTTKRTPRGGGLERKNSLKDFLRKTLPVHNKKKPVYTYKKDDSFSLREDDNDDEFEHSCSITVESLDQSASLSDFGLYSVSQVAELQVEINEKVMLYTKRKNEIMRSLQSALQLSKARHEMGSTVGATISMRRVQKLRNELERLKVMHSKLMEIFLQVDVEANNDFASSFCFGEGSTTTQETNNPLVDVDVPLHQESLRGVEDEVTATMEQKLQSGVLTKTDAELLAELEALVDEAGGDDENEFVEIDSDLLAELENLVVRHGSTGAGQM